jgi:hypothetical protein
MFKIITEKEIEKVQKKWAESLVKIGRRFFENKDYKTTARNHVEVFYGYREGTVLFKPTLANNKQFRKTFESALSYFIGGNPEFPNDKGFALNPWKEVRFENSGFILKEHSAIAMGNYFFIDFQGNATKVEFTLGFYRSEEGPLKINLHHSSIPYNPE